MIYLDNCSTTKPRQEVIEATINSMTYEYGNPSSLHRMGLKAEEILRATRYDISKYLDVSEREIYFTSGGTESNNIVLQGLLYNKENCKVITTPIEHSAISKTLERFPKIQIEKTKLDENGRIDLDFFRGLIDQNTCLVSIIYVNNETGVIQDIKGIVEAIKSTKYKPHIHLDAVQAFGKIPLYIKGIDSLSFSAHKIYGPKGIGGLFLRKGVTLPPLIYGGGQELGLRSGTENTQGIAGMGACIKKLVENQENDYLHALALKEELIKEFIDYPDTLINSLKYCSPYITSLSFKWTKGEVLLHYLEDKGIYVSTQAACSSNSKKQSQILKALNVPADYAEGTIRICTSYETTLEDIKKASKEIKDAVEDIRKVMRR